MTGTPARTSTVRAILKGAYHAARNLPDRLLHPRRYRAARRRLAETQLPKRILVACYGNVCRSPYLQAVLQRALPEIEVLSAGFIGGDRPVPPVSVALSAERGIDLSRYRSRALIPSTVYGADLIIVMDSHQATEIGKRFPGNQDRVVIAGDLDPHFAGSRAIRDPWNKSSEVFATSFGRLDRCAATLVSALGSAR